MIHWRSFIFGILFGGAAIGCYALLNTGHKILDHGISLTYALAEQDTLRKESDVLKSMAEPHWLGHSKRNAVDRLKDLDIHYFEKGDMGLAAGPVFLCLEDGIVAGILTHSARFGTEDCKLKGES
ncbi:hypothetical protein J7382_04585 [Shimia sp. R11_0]|uniref:hypothetical protein n=1 Tax=Shimia sp. R11_0 TaxID=2821096 RepID=UPI001ADB5C88|nr:hypothetical protein [Shimia sp. R11_0]MBO9476805.1 hypothetical protein [Shimia sp. R11_0]